MNKRLLSGLVLGFCCSSPVWALAASGVSNIKPDEQAALQELMSLLNKQTELVTKTKVNADFVPGSLTVLRGSELRAYGIRTVKQALDMSPNIEVQLNHLGQSVLVSRGLGTPFSGGTMKLMLNDVNRVSSTAGFAEGILNMPMEQVERIEIVRGAASVLHGDFAYSGVVNVVSREASRVSVAGGTSGYAQMAAGHHFDAKDSDASFSIQFAQWQTDKTGTKVRGDALTMADSVLTQNPPFDNTDYAPNGALAAYSLAPGSINDRRAYQDLMLGFNHKQTNVYLQVQEYQTGDYFGAIEFLPNPTRDYNQTYQDLALGVRHQTRLDSNWDSQWHLGAQQRSYDLQTFYNSADIAGDILSGDQTHPAVIGLALELPEFANVRPHQNVIREQIVNLSGHLIYQASENARWLFGSKLERHHIAQSFIRDEIENNPSDRFGTQGDARTVFALFAQNEWKPIEKMTVTIGVRAQKTSVDYYDISQKGVSKPFENLEDWFITPKLAVVYALDNDHIVKAQYSQSMITPPIHQVVNVGGNPELKPYTSQTDHVELGYIFQGFRHVQRLTGFYSDFTNVPQGTVYYNYFRERFLSQWGYKPLNKITTFGVEWDSEFSLTSHLSGFASAALISARDVDNDRPLVGSTNRMAKLGLSYIPSANWRLSAWSQLVGERYREPYDSRDKLPSYALAHMTLGYKGLAKGMTLSVSVENLADTEYQYPSPVNGTLTGLAQGQGVAAYMDDYPGAGRQVWAKLNYEF